MGPLENRLMPELFILAMAMKIESDKGKPANWNLDQMKLLPPDYHRNNSILMT